MKPGWLAAIILVAVVLAAGFKYTAIRNRLVMDREAIRAAWGQVDLALDRRSDVIAGLLDTVQGRLGQQPTAAAVESARAELESARTPEGKIQANARLDDALSRLLLGVEDHPRPREGKELQRLRDELRDAGNRVAVERRKYNDAVQKYNTEIELFPNNVVAGLAGFERDDAYFKTGIGARR